ncbi:MAG: tetratricopeptide repeat protein [Phycisphaerales bacterium]|nr:MAG: tetratricopeptide repeat protein [Phycisphaerales bacterium]
MDHGRRRKVEQLFQEAMDLPDERRSSFLNEHCATEPSLRADVEALLAGLKDRKLVSLSAVEQTREGETDLVGTYIGPYRLLELIGEGGLGAVYMADQEKPVRRRVALKIIKFGMDTKQVIARFEAERQALAMMDHPNVAKVFDAGATEAGRPYFAMELVRGNPITDYCDENRLTIQQRLELFTQVCRAVQHAHQKSIIHRDIKPSNVMVTLHDGTPAVKIIDFGIAKATRGPLTDKTLFTRYHQFLGTPEYMSPEQAKMSGLDIDTRSDIYSLGVLLYELLTGEIPFDRKALQNTTLGEIQRIIREHNPVTPSRRVTALAADSKAVARTRRADVRSLSRHMRGDLDWIVMKALEKDRSRRYETAAALAEDIRRHLHCEPISAGPPSKIYQFGKLARRHKVAFGFAAALFAIVVGFGIWMALLYTETEKQRTTAEANLARARAAEQRATTMAQSASDVAEFLVGLFEMADPYVPGWDPAVARGLLDKGVEAVRRELKNQPVTQATILATVGRIYVSLGMSESAEPLLMEALQLRRSRFGARHSATIEVLNILAVSYMNSGRLSAAEALIREAMESGHSAEDNVRPATLRSIALLAETFASRGRFSEAEPLGREALVTSRRTFGKERCVTLELTLRLAKLLQFEGKSLEAEELAREALQTRLRVSGDTDLRSTKAMTTLARILLARGELSEAESLLRRAHQISQELSGDNNIQSIECVFALAELARRQGKLAEAAMLCRQACARSREVVGDENSITLQGMSDLGRTLLEQGRLAESEQVLREALGGLRRILGDRTLFTLECLTRLTNTLLEQSKVSEAEAVVREYLATAGETLPEDTCQIATAESLLGACHIARRDFEVAERLLLASHPVISSSLGQRQEITKQAIERIVGLYEVWGRPEQVSKWRAKLAVESGQ